MGNLTHTMGRRTADRLRQARRRPQAARLVWGEGCSIREAARRLGVQPTTISRDLRFLEESLDDQERELLWSQHLDARAEAEIANRMARRAADIAAHNIWQNIAVSLGDPGS